MRFLSTLLFQTQLTLNVVKAMLETVMLLPLLLKFLLGLEASLLTVLVVAQTSSFVVAVPLVTVVPLRAGAVTPPPTAATTVPPTLAPVVLPATSPLTANVAQMARSVSTLAMAIVALWVVGVETRLSIAVLVARRVSVPVP